MLVVVVAKPGQNEQHVYLSGHWKMPGSSIGRLGAGQLYALCNRLATSGGAAQLRQARLGKRFGNAERTDKKYKEDKSFACMHGWKRFDGSGKSDYRMLTRVRKASKRPSRKMPTRYMPEAPARQNHSRRAPGTIR